MWFADAPRNLCHTPERRGEYVTCHLHGCILDTSDPQVVCDDQGRYFCNRECRKQWLEEQREADEEETPAVA